MKLVFTFTGIPALTILYLSKDLIFNCFDTNIYSSKSIFSLHFLKVGFPMITFIATYLPRLKEMSMVFFGILVMCYVRNQ